MNLRYFSLFVLTLCFLLPSVGFSMEDDQQSVAVQCDGKLKRAMLEDLMQHVDPDVPISLSVGSNFYARSELFTEHVKRFFPLGKCRFSANFINTWSDEDLARLHDKNPSGFAISTTTTDLKDLVDKRHLILKAIGRVYIDMSYIASKSENFLNYVESLDEEIKRPRERTQ